LPLRSTPGFSPLKNFFLGAAHFFFAFYSFDHYILWSGD
jgi:hypothetical protein